ncbi:MAG: hypothetical protein U0271_45920 [Polyangiaceae bacterium]
MGPLGCLPDVGMPEMAVPEMPPMEVPQAPEIQVPEFKPPEIQKPEGPNVPLPPGQGGGNCCLRHGTIVNTKCGGADTCCSKDFADTAACEDVKGYWFFTTDGCAGAC